MKIFRKEQPMWEDTKWEEISTQEFLHHYINDYEPHGKLEQVIQKTERIIELIELFLCNEKSKDDFIKKLVEESNLEDEYRVEE